MPICKLCLKDKKLCKSHVIPDFFYGSLYDEKHFINVINPNNFENGKSNSKKLPTGEYDKNILCEDCEVLLSKYETYGKLFFYGDYERTSNHVKWTSYIEPNGFKFMKAENINYNLLKIFFLSILWRASVSTREFFKEIKLGIEEEKIREMIFEEASVKQNNYPFLCFTYLNKKDLPSGLITQPSINSIKGFKVCEFIIKGFIFKFIISTNVKYPDIMENTLLENGTIRILDAPENFNRNTFLDYLGI